MARKKQLYIPGTQIVFGKRGVIDKIIVGGKRIKKIIPKVES